MANQVRSASIQSVQPKLRMVANGDSRVNVLRAEQAAAVKVLEPVAKEVPLSRSQSARIARRVPRAALTPGRLRSPPDAYVSTFVEVTWDALEDGASPDGFHGETARKGNLVTAEMLVNDALELGAQHWVANVELGQPLATPTPTVAADRPRAPLMSLRRIGDPRVHRFGEGVLIGLVDVQGIQFDHEDFLDGQGKTRVVSIWDQGGNTRPSPAERGTSRFDYGSELVKDDLDRAIAASRTQGLPAYLLEPQSQMEDGAHATHVASIAAGNRGICRKAAIAVVLISIPKDDEDRRLSFYDSSRLAHAVDHLIAVAGQRGMRLSINISLGTNGHAHDDSSAVSRWIDAALTTPGRCVSVAAGNAGQERPEHEGDIGYILGRVHTCGQIKARDLEADLEWNVVGNGIADISENELEIWYEPGDQFSVQVKPPGEPWTVAVQPGEFIENRQLPDGSFLSVYNELYNPANGCNYIAVYLSPLLQEGAVVGVRGGQWLVRLKGLEVRDGRFHAWLERDDPSPIGRTGDRETWVFPSFFSERTFVDSSTVSSLACGQRIVSVANLDESKRQIAITSSQGPTRDNRQKPDIAAPGTDIVAARGFSHDSPWVSMSGTSMASPYVAGVAGLMLAANPALTSAQIAGIIKRTARPLPGRDFSWRNDAGSGRLDPDGCIAEATAMLVHKDVTKNRT
jgi:subtilisin family serine protease